MVKVNIIIPKSLGKNNGNFSKSLLTIAVVTSISQSIGKGNLGQKKEQSNNLCSLALSFVINRR